MSAVLRDRTWPYAHYHPEAKDPRTNRRKRRRRIYRLDQAGEFSWAWWLAGRSFSVQRRNDERVETETGKRV